MEQWLIRSARVTGALTLVAIPVWLYMVAFVAPEETVQKVVQKIFYAHVPCWPPAYLGFLLTAVGGIAYLRTREDAWDRFALAAAEVGVLFCTLGLITGPLWAKPIWGVWWVWDLRLTSTLVLWFIYVAYLFLRAFAYGSDTARTFAAVYGILGTSLIPLVYFAVDLAQRSTMHPSNPASEGLPSGMGSTILVGMAAYLLAFCYLAARRLELATLEAREEEALWAT